MSDPQNKSSSLLDGLQGLNTTDLKEIEERLKEARDKTSELIRTYPLTSIAVGLGIGFLIGRMFSRK